MISCCVSPQRLRPDLAYDEWLSSLDSFASKGRPALELAKQAYQLLLDDKNLQPLKRQIGRMLQTKKSVDALS